MVINASVHSTSKAVRPYKSPENSDVTEGEASSDDEEGIMLDVMLRPGGQLNAKVDEVLGTIFVSHSTLNLLCHVLRFPDGCDAWYSDRKISEQAGNTRINATNFMVYS